MIKKRFLFFAAAFASLLMLGSCGSEESSSESALAEQAEPQKSKLVVYSSRKEHLIKPVFERYTANTGVEIEYLTDKAGVLVERLKAEGDSTQADLLITVDAGMLGYAASEGVLQTLNSEAVVQSVTANLRDPQDRWTGLSKRARTLVYSTERVDPASLSTYEALGDAEWRGRLCLRTSKKVYNQSLVAMLIGELGEERAEAIVSAWVANLAIPPTSNDTKVMEAILAGQCDVGVVNTYYFGRLQAEDSQIPLALFWPGQAEGERGVHVNVAGAGITQHSDNAAAARTLIEWLVSEEAQAIFAGVNKEYPVVKSADLDPQVAAWGEFTDNTQPLGNAYQLQPDAVKLMDRVGYR